MPVSRSWKSPALALAATASCTLAPTWAATAAKPCSYSDLMPAYQAFATRTEDLPPEQRATAFRKDFAARYPDYYSPEVFGNDSKLQSRAERFFDPTQRRVVPDNPPLTDAQLAQMGAAAGRLFAQAQRRFIRTFADFQCATNVEFGVSLLMFDGHPVTFAGQEHLLFGVDLIAALHGEADLPSFFDHEIFHLYHKQIIAAQLPKDEAAWVTLWGEGLATYVSQRMNPHLNAQQVLWFPRDIVARMQKETPRAAQLLLQDLDKTGMPGDRWFLMGNQVECLPDRAGYYLGYLFAKSVGDGVPLPVLTRMPLAQVHEQARAFLTGLARQ